MLSSVPPNFKHYHGFSLSEVDIGLDSMIKTEYREKEKAVLAPPAANVPSKELEELECFIVRERKFEQQWVLAQ